MHDRYLRELSDEQKWREAVGSAKAITGYRKIMEKYGGKPDLNLTFTNETKIRIKSPPVLVLPWGVVPHMYISSDLFDIKTSSNFREIVLALSIADSLTRYERGILKDLFTNDLSQRIEGHEFMFKSLEQYYGEEAKNMISNYIRESFEIRGLDQNVADYMKRFMPFVSLEVLVSK